MPNLIKNLAFWKKKLSVVARFLAKWLMTGWLVLWFWLIWLVGNTEWQVIIFSVGLIMIWVIGWCWQKLQIITKTTTDLVEFDFDWIFRDEATKWWFIWFGLLIISTITSQIWPISWLQLHWWLITFGWFWWFGSLRPLNLAQKLVWQSVLIAVTGASISGWWLVWQRPFWISNLPSVNYFIPSFGHHHISALIVLIWPAVWIKMVESKTWQWRGVGLVFFISLIASFSRSALIAVSLQLLIWYWLEASKLTKKTKIIWRFILIGALICFGLFSLFKFIIPGLDTTPLKTQLCYSWWTPSGICASDSEPRFVYWRQALIVWQHFPWLGSGPGTYGMVTRRWISQIINQSSYAHQVVLQNLAEVGMIGLIGWLLLIGNWLKRFWHQSKLLDGTLSWRLGILGGLIIGLLDFDWQMFGYWLVFVAILAVWQAVIKPDQKTLARTWQTSVSKIILMILLGIFTLSSSLGALGILLPNNFNWLKKWWSIWPMQAEWYGKITLNDQNQDFFNQYISKISPKHLELVTKISLGSTEISEKKAWQEVQWNLDPWRYWESNPLRLVVETEDWSQAEKISFRFDDWLKINRSNWPDSQNENFSVYIIKLASHEFETGNYPVGVRLLCLAQKLDPWNLEFRKLDFVEIEKHLPDNSRQGLIELSKIDQSKLGENQNNYLYWYQLLTKIAISELKQDKTYQLWLNDNEAIQTATDRELLMTWTAKVYEFITVYDKLFPQDLSRLNYQLAEIYRLKITADFLKFRYEPIYQSWLINDDAIKTSADQAQIHSWSENVLATFKDFSVFSPESKNLYDWQIAEADRLKTRANFFKFRYEPIYQSWLINDDAIKTSADQAQIHSWSENVLTTFRDFSVFSPESRNLLDWQIAEISQFKIRAQFFKIKYQPIYLTWLNDTEIIKTPNEEKLILAWSENVLTTFRDFSATSPESKNLLDWQIAEIDRFKIMAVFFKLKYDPIYLNWLKDTEVIKTPSEEKLLLDWSENVLTTFRDYSAGSLNSRNLLELQKTEIDRLKLKANFIRLRYNLTYLNWLNDGGHNYKTYNYEGLKNWLAELKILFQDMEIATQADPSLINWQLNETQQLKLSAEILELKNSSVYKNCQTNLEINTLPFNCPGLSDWSNEVASLGKKFLEVYPDELTRPQTLAVTLADLLITAGDASVGTNTYKVASLYQLGQKFCPWILNNRLWWFEVVGVDIYIDKKELLAFADAWQDFNGDVGGYKPAVWQNYYLTMIDLANSLQDQNRVKIYQEKLKIIQAK